MKKILAYIKANKSLLAKVGLMSLLFCILMSDQVGKFIFEHMVHYHEVKVNTYAISDAGVNNPKIIDNNYDDETDEVIPNIVDGKLYGFYDFEKLKNSIIDSQDIMIVEPQDSIYGYGYFEFQSLESYIIFKVPVYPNTCLTVSADSNAYGLQINDEKTAYYREVNDYENNATLNSCKIYLYSLSDYLYVLMEYVILYLLFFSLGFICILTANKIVRDVLSKSKVLNAYNPIGIFITISILYIGFTTVSYYCNWNTFQVGEGADAYYYMNPQIWDENGKFSIQATANYLYTFRGYFTIVVDLVADYISSFLGIEKIYMYFVYYGLVTAFTIGIACPKLYTSLTDKQTSNIMCLIMYGLFWMSWRNLFFYSLTDIPAAMLAVCAVSFIITSIKKNSKIDAVFSGVFIGISTSYRAAYTYVFFLIIVYLLISILISIIKKNDNIKKQTMRLVLLLFGLAIVVWPQYIINQQKNHIGIFPYNSGWVNDVNSREVVDITWADFTTGLHQYTFMGTQNTDKQMGTIDQYYYMDKYYTIGDLIYLVFSNPLGFLQGYIKRLFWAMSAGIESVYGGLRYPGWLGTLTIWLNYFCIGNLIYAFFNKRMKSIFTNKIKIMYGLFAMVTIVIQNLLHIERRYYLFYYLLIYFFMAFIFHDCVKVDKEEKTNWNYAIMITIVILVSYTMRNVIYYNFL